MKRATPWDPGAGGRGPGSLSDWTAEAVRERILSGEYAVGQPLVISELAPALQVSQTPLREALQRLASEGLVTYHSNRRVEVAGLTEEDVRDAASMRMLLEPLALERAMQRADAAWRALITSRFEDLEHAEGADPVEQEVAHRAFHHALISGCSSAVVKSMVGTLLDHSARHRLLGRAGVVEGEVPDPGSGFAARHLSLFEACLSMDIERAKAEDVAHIARATEAQVERLRARGYFDDTPTGGAPTPLPLDERSVNDDGND